MLLPILRIAHASPPLRQLRPQLPELVGLVREAPPPRARRILVPAQSNSKVAVLGENRSSPAPENPGRTSAISLSTKLLHMSAAEFNLKRGGVCGRSSWIPKGFRPEAQGCANALPWVRDLEMDSTATWLWQTSRAMGRTN